MITPLNGTKTHPLTEHAKDILRALARGASMPVQEINAGVWNRFRREALVESVPRPSPYKVHKGANIPHAIITKAGRAAITS